MLPTLTPLQYLAIHLLLVGPQSGRELRRGLRAMGLRQTRPSFCRLMSRLVDAGYVAPEPATQPDHAGRRVHFCRYQVTDLAFYEWSATRKFYVNLAPPVCPPSTLSTEPGRLAAYDPQTRRAAMKRAADQYARQLKSTMMQITQAAIKDESVSRRFVGKVE
jgi:hypothetical protein